MQKPEWIKSLKTCFIIFIVLSKDLYCHPQGAVIGSIPPSPKLECISSRSPNVRRVGYDLNQKCPTSGMGNAIKRAFKNVNMQHPYDVYEAVELRPISMPSLRISPLADRPILHLRIEILQVENKANSTGWPKSQVSRMRAPPVERVGFRKIPRCTLLIQASSLSGTLGIKRYYRH